jgi:hypothetical protein
MTDDELAYQQCLEILIGSAGDTDDDVDAA